MMLMNAGHIFLRCISKKQQLCGTLLERNQSLNQFFNLRWVSQGKKSVEKKGLTYAECRIKEFTLHFTPWFILRKLGVPKGTIIEARRVFIKYSYPWTTYYLSAALAMGLGDFVAQKHEQKYIPGFQENKYDYCRTLRLAFIGLFLVGPILRNWNYYFYRKMRCFKQSDYAARKIVYDVLYISPLLLAITMAVYEYETLYKLVKVRYDNWSGRKPLWPELKCLWNEYYRAPFLDIMHLNLTTRPLLMLIVCYLSPKPLQKLLRRLYEISFMAFVSHRLKTAKLGEIEDKQIKNDIKAKKDPSKDKKVASKDKKDASKDKKDATKDEKEPVPEKKSRLFFF